MKNNDNGVYLQMIGALIVIGIFSFLGMMIFNSSNDYDNTKTTQTQHSPDYYRPGAFMAAEKFVKTQLKSPGSAKFPPSLEKKKYVSVSPDGITYDVSSWVDSQNSYGGLVRTYFSCTVKRYDRQNDYPEWELVDVKLLE